MKISNRKARTYILRVLGVLLVFVLALATCYPLVTSVVPVLAQDEPQDLPSLELPDKGWGDVLEYLM
jgi:hypothetical protein